MKNILDELYDMDLFHLTEIVDVSDEYKSAMDRLLKAETELLKAYPDCKEILDEYQSQTLICTIFPTVMSSARVSEQVRSSFLK